MCRQDNHIWSQPEHTEGIVLVTFHDHLLPSHDPSTALKLTFADLNIRLEEQLNLSCLYVDSV